MNKPRYLVLGAGMQGTAAAYDFGRFGEAAVITLADVDARLAGTAAANINKLLHMDIVQASGVDVSVQQQIVPLMSEHDVCLSAVPYFFNQKLSTFAIEGKCHFCDLGGNTDIVFEQHKLNDPARAAGIAIVPDCGLAPGMANILAAHGINQVDNAKAARIRVGGLPQVPQPPLGYRLFFSIEGLTNEYFGKAIILKNGKVTEVDTFTDLEEIEFPQPIGKCEAFMTYGGTSTCPWTFEGRIQEYDEKTIRYPGHYDKMKTIHDLGLLDLAPVTVNGVSVVPRDVYHAIVEPRLKAGDPRDIVLLRVIVDGRTEQLTMDVIDYFDEMTGFTAMQRTTGFGAAIVGIMLAKGELKTGSLRLEEVIDTGRYIDEMKKRGFQLQIRREKRSV
jgi:lysine 6-dehydrogenase